MVVNTRFRYNSCDIHLWNELRLCFTKVGVLLCELNYACKTDKREVVVRANLHALRQRIILRESVEHILNLGDGLGKITATNEALGLAHADVLYALDRFDSKIGQRST